ncbi:MAG: double-strand break repair protein AddB, partial [Beijerinckiaceae bacterium]|nr:double-strand break repair protein AddB [Beijerinckiaceae bacterium]
MDAGSQAEGDHTRRRPNLLTIPIGRPFFKTFVAALLNGEIVPAIDRSTDPLAFADATIFVPTRRSGRALAQVLAEALGPRPAILPRIVPLGDPANLDDRSIISEETISGLDGLDPAVPPLRRRLELMRLIEHWRVAVRDSLSRDDHGHGALLGPDDLFQVASSPADAFGLAGDLAALIDEMTIEGVDWSKLDGLVLGHDQYWDITTRFLMIAGEAWPAWLKEEGLCDEAARRKSLFEREAERLLAERPPTPMIVAGSTGSQPATAALMRAISLLPNGAVILPGLDQHLDEDSWAAIATSGPDVALGSSSPQAMLKRLLDERMGVSRGDVRALGGDDAFSVARAMLMSETLRPAETTDLWAVPQDEAARAAEDRLVTAAFEGVSIIEAADEREEALAIAIRMRECLLEPDKTVALVTPDRPLGLRVAAELSRFGIDVDDSAGRSLSRTPRGVIAHHALDVAQKEFEPCSVLGLLHHEHLGLGLPRAEIDAMLAAFDIGLMRNGPIEPGIQGLRRAADEVLEIAGGRRAPAPQRRLAPSIEALMDRLLVLLDDALGPLAEAMKDHRCSLQRLARLHREALERLTRREDGSSTCFDEEDGETLERIFEALSGDEDTPSHHGRGHDGKGFAVETYLPLFDALLNGETVRLRSATHRRLRIYGPLEARLLETDVTILGGLNEGTWPSIAETDAFLNRPMRAAMGLSPPERRIGQSAHDFSMLMGGREVVIARASRVDGAPTIASRFLRRLKAYAGEAHWKAAVGRGERYVAFARRMDEPGPETAAATIARPEPKPPLDWRPKTLSITEIETLYRDPYAIFARHVL